MKTRRFCCRYRGAVEHDWYMANSFRPIPAGSVPGPVDALKVVKLGNLTYGLAFSGQASPNGTLYNPELAAAPVSTGMIYTKLFTRHWDTC